MDPDKGPRLRSQRRISQFCGASSIPRIPWNFQLSGLSTPGLQRFVNSTFVFSPPALVPQAVFIESLLSHNPWFSVSPVCLCNLGSRGLPCVLPSLTDPRQVLVFQSVQFFFFFFLLLGWHGDCQAPYKQS